jgi:hypothetical protein
MLYGSSPVCQFDDSRPVVEQVGRDSQCFARTNGECVSTMAKRKRRSSKRNTAQVRAHIAHDNERSLVAAETEGATTKEG